MIEITAIYVNVFLVYLIRKGRSPAGKTKLMWEASRRSFFFSHFAKLFISLVVTISHLLLSAFIWNMILMCILVYNLEPHVYFIQVFVEVLCHGFNFVNMRFVAKIKFFGIYFSLLNSTKKIYFHGKFFTEFC